MMNDVQTKVNQLYNQVSMSVAQGTFPHGILIECQNEVEGEAFASYIANCLVCRSNQKPCGVCPDCVKAQGKGHPDIFTTDGKKGKSNTFSVDAIREIRDDAFIIPNESDKKIYVLKNGQNMNEQSQNAILKILEEPPSYVFFIIVTTSKSTMLETVLSRVQVFSLLSDEEKITEKEMTIVKNMVSAIININEIDLMEQTAVFVKNNQLARTILSLLTEVFRDALVIKSGFSREFRFSKESETLSNGLTSKSLMNLITVCDDLINSIDRNCNNNLLVVRMCYEFKRAMGR